MCRSDRKRRRRKKRREKRWARNKIWIDRCHLDRHADVTRRKVSSFLDLNIKLLPFSLQILRISILHGRNFNPWSVITNCTRLFRPPLAFHLFSSSFLRFFLSRGMLSASIVRRLLRRIFFSSATIRFFESLSSNSRIIFREDELGYVLRWIWNLMIVRFFVARCLILRRFSQVVTCSYIFFFLNKWKWLLKWILIFQNFNSSIKKYCNQFSG